MKIKNIILNSESEFRKYIISNSDDILKIFVFEDSLDPIIFFYCFFSNGLIIATKEPSTKEFLYYNKIYTQLTRELNLDIDPDSNFKVLKIKKQ